MPTTIDGRTATLSDRRYIAVDSSASYVWTDEHFTNGTVLPGPCFTHAEWDALRSEQDALEQALAALAESAKPRLVKCEPGAYNLVEDGLVTYSLTRTRRGDWYDHNPAYPWVVARRFWSGSQVEARFRTFAAAKQWLLG